MTLNKRQLQKEQTRKQIINAAYQIYAEQGFTATTSDIARSIHVSHGTIFVHFPTRDDLLIQLLEDFDSRIVTRMHELTETSEQIPDVLYAHLNAIEEYEGFYTRLINESRLLPAEVRNNFIAIQSTIAFHMSKVIRKDPVLSKCDLPSYFIFNTWVGLVHYYLQNNDMFAPESSVIGRYKDELIANFLKLIKT